MGVTRQGVAIGLTMVAVVALGKGKALQFVLWIAFAALFHKSDIILVPMALLAETKRKVWMVLWVGVVAVVLFILLLQESLENLRYQYLEGEMQSSGAAIRITMNAIPAALFLRYRRRFTLPKRQERFWTWLSLSALMFIFVLYISPSSAIVDRIALYWLPLQVFVWSRLPIAFGNRPGNKIIWIALVLGYSAAIMFVWLVFAVHAYAWLPYQFYPIVWLL